MITYNLEEIVTERNDAVKGCVNFGNLLLRIKRKLKNTRKFILKCKNAPLVMRGESFEANDAAVEMALSSIDSKVEKIISDIESEMP